MATVLNHPVLSFGAVDTSLFPPAQTDAEIDAEIRREWKNDREVQDLLKLAYALGVGKIILIDRYIDGDLGEYICARNSRESHRESLKDWSLSRKQLTAVNRVLFQGRGVILISHNSSGDFAATLAHEIGHHINQRLDGLSRLELFPQISGVVTKTMRRVARFREYFYQNRDEYYAETWARYLCGGENRAFRYLKTRLGRLRIEHPEKTRLIEDHRARVCDR
jgi:hypothetical protein